MPNHLKFCSCRMCRIGMRRSARSAAKVKRTTRRLRHLSRIALRHGLTPPSTLSVGRTD